MIFYRHNVVQALLNRQAEGFGKTRGKQPWQEDPAADRPK